MWPPWGLPGGLRALGDGEQQPVRCEPRDGDSLFLTSPRGKAELEAFGEEPRPPSPALTSTLQAPFCSDAHGRPRFRFLSAACSLPLGSETLTPEPKNSFPLPLRSGSPATGLLSGDRAVTTRSADAQPSTELCRQKQER